MNYRHIATASLAAATIALAACGGGGHVLPPSANGGATSKPATMTKATLRVLIPARSASARRRPTFISKSTKAIVVAVFTSPYNNGAVPTANGAFDVSTTSPSCTPDVSSGGSLCTFSIAVPAGTDDFLVSTYDTAPVNNAIPAGALRLGYGRVSNVHVVAGADNQIPLTLGGVVAKVALSMQVPATPDPNWSCNPTGTACALPHVSNLVSKTVTVSAVDAKGNTIVTDDWVDADGNPVSITVSADNSANPVGTPAPLGFNTPAPSPSASASPVPTGTPAAIVTFNSPAPGGNSFTMTFDPSKLSYAQMTGGFGTAGNNAATVTAQASNNISGTATVKLLPAVIEYPIPAPTGTGGTNPEYIRVAADNKKLWIAQHGSGSVVSFDTTTLAWSSSYPANPLPTTGPTNPPNYGASTNELAPVSDGSALWFIEQGASSTANQSKIAKLSLPAPAAVPYMTETSFGFGTSGWATGIAQDNNGYFWVTVSGSSFSKIIKFDPSTMTFTNGPATNYTSGNPLDIMKAADGSMWFGDSRTPNGVTPGWLYQLNPSTGTYVTTTQVPGAGAGVSAMTIDAHGLVWVAESSRRIACYNPATGTWSTEMPASPSALGGTPEQIVAAPDGSIWVTEQSGKIARIVPGASFPSTSTLTEIPAATGSKILFGIVPDPSNDGSLWYTDYSTNVLSHLYP